MKASDIEMFEPSPRDMKLDYPELSEVAEFEQLNARELKFCWYVGSRTSPLASIPKKKRLSVSANTAWGGYHADRKEVKELAAGKIPDKIMTAIEKMSSFNPTVRLRAKFMQEYIFDKMQAIILISDTELKEMDADEKKKYADLALKISSDLTHVVDRMEAGYGVKKRERDTKKSVVKRTISDIIDKID